jgi:Bacterial Ig-like domain (group 1)
MQSRSTVLAARFLIAFPLLTSLACDKATPIAPTGTVLSVSANPSRIGLNGTSTVTVIGRKPDGNPLNRGTEIRLSSSLGTISSLVVVDETGTASATLQGDGRSGEATVTATTGDGTVSATATVQVGESASTKPVLTVSANPNNLPVQTTATVTIIARNSDGTAVASGQTVILTTNLGSLNPNRPLTRADGTATSTFNSGNQAGEATIRAILGSSDAAEARVVIRDSAAAVDLQANPSSVARTGGTLTLTAFVPNGLGQPLQQAPVTFQSDRGILSTTTAFTNSSGIATATLTLTQEVLVNVTSFAVKASTPRGNGEILSSSLLITVQ